MEKRDITTEDMYSKLEPFSSYHAMLLFLVNFIGVFCGQLMSFNVFGHYEPGKSIIIDNPSVRFSIFILLTFAADDHNFLWRLFAAVLNFRVYVQWPSQRKRYKWKL